MKRKIHYLVLDFFEDGTRAAQTSIAEPSTCILSRKVRKAYIKSDSPAWNDVENAIRNLAKEVPFEKDFPADVFTSPVEYRFAVPVKKLQKVGDDESLGKVWKAAELLLDAKAVDKATIVTNVQEEIRKRDEKANQVFRDFLDGE